MSLREDIAAWLDPYSMVAPNSTRVSNNGVLYSSEFYVLLAMRGELMGWDSAAFTQLISAQCELEPGLIRRNPGCADQEGPDDYIGLMAAYWHLGLWRKAREVVDYGSKSTRVGPFTLHWFFNNVEAGTPWEQAQEDPGRPWYLNLVDRLYAPTGKRFNASAWLGRQPQLISHFLWCAELKPAWWRRLWAAVTVMLAHSKPVDDVDSRILSWLCIWPAYERCWMMRAAATWFLMDLHEQYPGGMQGVFSHDFEPTHPIARYAVDQPKGAIT